MKTLRTLVVVSIMAVTLSGCMKPMIEGLGLGCLEDKQIKACGQNIIDSYIKYKQADTDGTMKQNYEITFDCKMPEGI